MRLRSFLGLRSLPRSQQVPTYSHRAPFWGPKGPKVKKRGSQNGPHFWRNVENVMCHPLFFLYSRFYVSAENSIIPCIKATWGLRGGGSGGSPLVVFRSADNSHFFRLLQFSGPHFYQFLAEPGPSPGPFLEKVDFEGHPKIVILGTESTYMSAENSINPCIKATSGPTSSIFWGSGI